MAVMSTAIFTHPACLGHDPMPGHPESPDRLRSVLRALRKPEFAGLEWHEAPEATPEQVLRVHTQAVLDVVLRDDDYAIDGDTQTAPGSKAAALRAAGAVCAAVEWVISPSGSEAVGRNKSSGSEAVGRKNAFCAVRPPGHHAEPGQSMGFCLLNNIAIGARHAQSLGVQRVAVLDFDVHHGNGTQADAWADEHFFFASTHQWPLYPGTGAAHETGAANNILNIPLRAGGGSAPFRQAWAEIILPRLAAFAPGLVFISAGFDAHLADPLGGLGLQTGDFGWITQEIMQISGNRVISSLEGGYNLAALADSAMAHVAALQGRA